MEDDIPANPRCEVLDERQDDDVGAKSRRFRWKWSIGKQHKREEQNCTIENVHLFEDRRLVYAWMVCQGKKEEGAFRCKQERKRLRKQNLLKSYEKKTDSVSIKFPVAAWWPTNVGRGITIGPWLLITVGKLGSISPN